MDYVKRLFSEISQLTGQDENITEPEFSGNEVDHFLKKTGLLLALAAIITLPILLFF